MILGFTGTRHGMTEAQQRAVERALEGCTEFHHGMCKGADEQAGERANRRGIQVICHPGPNGDPWRGAFHHDDEIRPPKKHLARNRDIVNGCDRLIATPAENAPQPRGGTWYTIRYAVKVGKPVTIIYPDGIIE